MTTTRTGYDCAFLYEDGAREEFTIHDRAEGAQFCEVTTTNPNVERAFTPGATLCNFADRVHGHVRRIAEVHAPSAVLAEALRHGKRMPFAYFSGYGGDRYAPIATRASTFPTLRLVETDRRAR